MVGADPLRPVTPCIARYLGAAAPGPQRASTAPRACGRAQQVRSCCCEISRAPTLGPMELVRGGPLLPPAQPCPPRGRWPRAASVPSSRAGPASRPRLPVCLVSLYPRSDPSWPRASSADSPGPAFPEDPRDGVTPGARRLCARSPRLPPARGLRDARRPMLPYTKSCLVLLLFAPTTTPPSHYARFKRPRN